MQKLRGFASHITIVAIAVAMESPAWAQDDDAWTYVITPQLWMSHIADNGFVSATPSPVFVGVFPRAGVTVDPFEDGTSSDPADTFDFQWGAQLAAQRRRWTFSLAWQSVDFETLTHYTYDTNNRIGPVTVGGSAETLDPGEEFAEESIHTSRTDIDVAASHSFLNVVPGLLDLSLGAGFKLIHAEAKHQYSKLSDVAAAINGAAPPGLYVRCESGDPDECTVRQRVKTEMWLYGLTIPMGAIIRATEDARLLVPINVAPFIGAQTRDDHDVVSEAEFDPAGNLVDVDTIDETNFAYGVTTDATIRWNISDTVSVYGGARLQYFDDTGDGEEYFAYGPLMGLSARFQL